MPCQTFYDEQGKPIGVVCSRVRRRRCSACGNLGAEILCDGPGARAGKTCDRALCRRCATSVGPDVDLCPAHAAARIGRAERLAMEFG
jgi:hypothetical protein